MKKLVLLLLVSIMATTAFAALDPDADSFGVYFDLAGNTNTSTAMTAVTKTCYILLMNPSTAIKGFELAYEIKPSGAMDNGVDGIFADDLLRVSQAIAGGSFVDVGASADPIVGDFRCGYATARPAVPAMLMVTWKFRYYGVQDEGMSFFLTGVLTNPSPPAVGNGLPVVDGGTGVGLRTAGVASGSIALPCAGTFPLNPVATENSSFGSVKSLFR